MASDELLEIYLNDHLAGATAGVELARKIADQTRDTPAGPALSKLADDIESDRTTLERLIEKLGADQHGVKQAAAWMVEKVSRCA